MNKPTKEELVIYNKVRVALTQAINQYTTSQKQELLSWSIHKFNDIILNVRMVGGYTWEYVLTIDQLFKNPLSDASIEDLQNELKSRGVN